jgi:hypothetical protein
MPLELGMAIACQKTVFPSHKWFVFEAKVRRIQKSMSDLDGTDVYIHRGRPSTLFSELSNAFVRSPRQASVGQTQRVFADVKRELQSLMRNGGAKPCPFEDLLVLARKLADLYIL